MVDDSSIPIHLITAVITFVLSSLFALSEYALENLNDSELKKHNPKTSAKNYEHLVRIAENDVDYIEAMHIGRLLTLFISVCCLFSVLLNRISALKTPAQFLLTLAFLAGFTLLSAVFVYLIPRHIAALDPIKVGTRMVGFIRLFRILFFPFVYINFYITKFLFRLSRTQISREPEKITEDSILSLVSEGQETGVIGDEESEMISNVFSLDDKTAGDVMTHRTEICAVEISDTLDNIMNVAISERYSRIPVYKDTVDNIIGIIHIKDLLRLDPATFKVSNILREASFVPESQKLDEVLNVLRSSSTHLAVVVDEYGGTAGIVTMEDILEELVGNIRDEYDSEEVIIEKQEITKIGENTYLIAGLTELETVNEQLGIEIPDDEYGTLSGFVIGLLGQIPEEDTHPTAVYENVAFTVESSNDRIITLLRVTVNEPETENAHVPS